MGVGGGMGSDSLVLSVDVVTLRDCGTLRRVTSVPINFLLS